MPPLGFAPLRGLAGEFSLCFSIATQALCRLEQGLVCRCPAASPCITLTLLFPSAFSDMCSSVLGVLTGRMTLCVLAGSSLLQSITDAIGVFVTIAT